MERKIVNICPFMFGYCSEMCNKDKPCTGWQKHLDYLEDPEYYNYNDPSGGFMCLSANDEPVYKDEL